VLRERVVDRRPQDEDHAFRVGRARRVGEAGGEAVDEHHQQLVLAAHVPVERHRRHPGSSLASRRIVNASTPSASTPRTTISKALLCTYWPDVDAAWHRAVRAGAEVVYPLADQFYGERGGRLGDPFGNQWMLAARIEALTPAEIAAREPA
jgi:uncharacterized glyoxalase superfamily protein PhnB